MLAVRDKFELLSQFSRWQPDQIQILLAYILTSPPQQCDLTSVMKLQFQVTGESKMAMFCSLEDDLFQTEKDPDKFTVVILGSSLKCAFSQVILAIQ